jgi:hypothetical protein
MLRAVMFLFDNSLYMFDKLPLYHCITITVYYSWVKQQLPGAERAYSVNTSNSRNSRGKSELAQLWYVHANDEKQ